jgi:CRP-like cAMP-binding protein
MYLQVGVPLAEFGRVAEPHHRTEYSHLGNLRVHILSSAEGSTIAQTERGPMVAIESLGSHVARLLPGAETGSVRHLERAARQAAFRRHDLLQARGVQLPPFVLLEGHAMARRVAETGQVRAALIAGPGYFGGLRSISDSEGGAGYELVALTDGAWATWEPQLVRDLAARDAGLAVGLFDQSSEFSDVLDMRLDERSFENARQRLAVILTRYGKVIFDTPHPVAQRADLAAMIGTSRGMMYRALRELEADGLVERQPGGGIVVLDEARLSALIVVAPPAGAPAL